MLDKQEVQEAIDKFRKYVVQQSKSNLTKQKKNASKSLYNSIKGVSKVNPNSISLYFEMEAHGVFQDKGVSGKEKKYNTPYSYKSKMPPTKALDKWVEEDYKDTIEEILMSEKILVNGYPAKLTTKTFEKYKNINTKQINYELDFTFNYQLINSVS